MQTSTIKFMPKSNKVLSREIIKQYCTRNVRKDLEIIRLQDTIGSLFRDTEFYSHYNDELASIDQTISLAFNDKAENIDQDLYNIITECSFKVSFNYQIYKKNDLEVIKYNSKKLVDLIFKTSEEIDNENAIKVFQRGFLKEFSHLDLNDLEIYLNSKNDNKKEFYHVGINCSAGSPLL